MGIDGHCSHDGVRDAGLVQTSRKPAHCLVLGTALLKEHADLIQPICETEALAVGGEVLSPDCREVTMAPILAIEMGDFKSQNHHERE